MSQNEMSFSLLCLSTCFFFFFIEGLWRCTESLTVKKNQNAFPKPCVPGEKMRERERQRDREDRNAIIFMQIFKTYTSSSSAFFHITDAFLDVAGCDRNELPFPEGGSSAELHHSKAVSLHHVV